MREWTVESGIATKLPTRGLYLHVVTSLRRSMEQLDLGAIPESIVANLWLGKVPRNIDHVSRRAILDRLLASPQFSEWFTEAVTARSSQISNVAEFYICFLPHSTKLPMKIKLAPREVITTSAYNLLFGPWLESRAA